jgi:hypothetical protein
MIRCVVSGAFTFLIVATAFESAAHADGAYTDGALAAAQAEARAGGVISQSYGYHRQPPAAAATIAPAGGWYGYGFPVSTYRWGWFGASRYYPTVRWHQGYYGDQCRWAYRYGY